MRDPSFMSSHPTGVPAGLTDLTPVIVNQSPELASRRGFDSEPYEEDLQMRSQLYEQKQPVSMDHYGGISAITYRAREQDQIAPVHANPYLAQTQETYAHDPVPASYNLARTTQNASYAQLPESGSAHITTSLPYYGRVTSWQPQQGSPGTDIQISLVTQLKIDVQRGVVAKFGRDEIVAVCQGGHEHTAPFRYLVSVQAPAPAVTTQWSKPKSAVPLCLFIPYEGIHSHPQAVGTFTYIETSAAASPSESELDHPRRPSESAYRYEEESPRHGNEMTAAHLPPIRADHSASTGQYAPSVYSTASSDGYSGQASTSSYYASSLVSSYGQTPGCTPPTPTWTGPTVSAATPMEPPAAGVVPLTNNSIGPGQLRAQPVFVRARSDGTSINSQHSIYNNYPMNKATIVFIGNLNDMTKNWTQREKKDKRRLVQFNRSQDGGTIHASFEGVDPEARDPNAIVVSCIYWESLNDYYVTSVDTIGLLEKLVVPGHTFTVEEKNRIRRNLEGHHPVTVGKAKPDTEPFFKLIMNFPMPRPRHIEKDVKVFKWKDLEAAAKKIIGKYVPSIAGVKRAGETAIHAENPRPALPAPFAGAGTHSYNPSMPLSSSSSSFSDSYAQGYQSYSQPQTPSYAPYGSQHQHHYGAAAAVPDSSHMMLQHRPSVGYSSYMDNHGATAFMS